MYYIMYHDEFGENNAQPHKYEDVRRATTEARDLQRILEKDKKDAGAHYAVLEDEHNSVIYKARGY